MSRNATKQQKQRPNSRTAVVQVTVQPKNAASSSSAAPRRQRRNRNTPSNNPAGTRIHYRKNAQMVSIPKDTRGAVAGGNFRSRSLDYIKQWITQTIMPEWAANIVRGPCLTDFKSHCTKFNIVKSLVIPASGNLAGYFEPSPSFMHQVNTEVYPSAAGLDAEIAQEAANTQGKNRAAARAHSGATNETYDLDSFESGGLQWLPFFLPSTGAITVTQANAVITQVVALDAQGAGMIATESPAGVYQFADDAYGMQFRTNPDITPAIQISSPSLQILPGFVTIASDGISLPESATQFLQVALSGLLTYEGSTLNNQGSFVMALTDPLWMPNEVDIYSALSKLPDKRFNGPLKTGGYGWWTATKMDEQTPKDLSYYDDTPYLSRLWFAIKGGEENVPVKMEGNTICAFADPNQVFAKVPHVGEAPIYTHVRSFYNSLPHVMPNDAHHDIGKELIQKVHGTVQAAVRDPIALGLGLVAMA